MLDLTFIDDRMKAIIGWIFIALCIFVRCVAPYYIEQYMLLLAIPAFGLISKRDYIKNSHIMSIITLILIVLVVVTSLSGLLNPTGTLAYLYYNGVLTVVPDANDVFTCSIGNLIVIIFALLNLICAAVYCIPTTTKKRGY